MHTFDSVFFIHSTFPKIIMVWFIKSLPFGVSPSNEDPCTRLTS